jgi:hypothetical protein
MDDLHKYCGQPLRQRSVVNGTLWSCHNNHNNWAALVVGDLVDEVWVVKSKH